MDAPAPPECPVCKESVTHEHFATAVLIQVYAPRLSRMVECGPFHGPCGTIFNQRLREQDDQVRR